MPQIDVESAALQPCRSITTLPALLAAPALVAVMLALAASFVIGQQALSPAEIRQIARDAYVYGFSMLDNYRIQYAYFADPANLDPHLNVQPCTLKFCHDRFQPHL